MTVRELIEVLSTKNQDARVFAIDTNYGFVSIDEIEDTALVQSEPDEDPFEWYDGAGEAIPVVLLK